MSYALVKRTPYAGPLHTHGVRLSNPTATLSKFGWKPNFSGTGVLSGIAIDTPNAPNPTPVEVRVLIRHENPDLDGLLVYKTSTTVGSTFSFENVDPNLRYDIIGRMEGRRDQIMSNVKPFNGPRFSPMQIPVGVPVDEPLPIVGGTGSVSASYVSGAFPSGVSLVGDRLQGSWPTGAVGSYPITFDLTDDLGTYTKVLDIGLYLLPMELAGSVPVLIVGDPMSASFTASGGEWPYTYAVTSGSLPAGLSLNGSTGVLSGTPAVSGPYSFGITATDVRGGTAVRVVNVDVMGPFATYQDYKSYVTNLTVSTAYSVSTIGGMPLTPSNAVARYVVADARAAFGGNMWGSPAGSNQAVTHDSSMSRVIQHAIESLSSCPASADENVFLVSTTAATSASTFYAVNKNGFTSYSYSSYGARVFTQFVYWDYALGRARVYDAVANSYHDYIA